MNSLKWGLIAAIGAFFISIFLGIISGVGIFYIFIRALIFTIVFFGLGFGLRFIINNFFPELLYGDDAAGDELYAGMTSAQASPGSRINITLDNTGEYAVPELYSTSDNSEGLGNIDDLISGIFYRKNGNGYRSGIDGNSEAGYNNKGGGQEFSLGLPEEVPFLEGDFQDSSAVESAPKQAVVKPNFTPSFGDDGGLGGLPDLDMMARAFSSTYNTNEPERVKSPSAQTGHSASFAPSSPSSSFLPSIEDIEPQSSRYKGNKPEPLKGDFNPKELAEGLRAVLNKDKQ